LNRYALFGFHKCFEEIIALQPSKAIENGNKDGGNNVYTGEM